MSPTTGVHRLAASVTMLGLIAIIAGCGSQPAQSTGGKTLVAETTFAIDSFDPARAASPTTIMVDHAIYDSLLMINPSDLSKPYPDLATSYSPNAAGTQYTFQLRHGVKFANGDPLTSADVVWSLTRDKNVGISGGSPGAAAITMQTLTVTAAGPYTVIVSSAKPDPAIPVKMTSNNTGVLDSTLVEQHGGTTNGNDKANSYLNGPSAAGSGPYVLQYVDRTTEVILKANPKYWGPKPTFDTVYVRNAPSATQRLDVQDGQAQLAIDISAVDATALNTADVNVFPAQSDDQTFLGMNNNPAVSPLTANPNFREAIKYALDYAGIVKLAGKGSIEATGFVPQGILGSLPASNAVQQDLSKAKADLAMVGVTNPTVTIDYFNDFCTDGLCAAPFAEKIQSDLQQIGITVKLNGAPLATLYPNKIAIGKSQIWLSVANPADYPDPSDFLGFGPGSYQSLYFDWMTGTDPSADAQFQAASSAVTPAARASDYQALGTAINAKAIFVFIFAAGKALVTAKSVHAIVNPYWAVDLGLVT